MQQKKEKDQGKGDRGCWDKRIGEWRGESFKGGSQGNPMEKRDLSKHLRKVRRILHSTNICLSSLLCLAFRASIISLAKRTEPYFPV